MRKYEQLFVVYFKKCFLTTEESQRGRRGYTERCSCVTSSSSLGFPLRLKTIRYATGWQNNRTVHYQCSLQHAMNKQDKI